MHGSVLDVSSFPLCPESVRLARNHAVRVYATQAEVSDERLQDIRLSVSELMTNAVRYGNGTRIAQLICHEPLGGVVKVELHDQGKKFPVRRQAGPDDENGRGLALIEGVGAQWSVSKTYSGKSVSFTLGA